MSDLPFKFGFWSDREYHLDRMNLRELAAAYFQYYAIVAYIGMALVSAGVVVWALVAGHTSLWPVVASVVASVLIYPVVWYALHRYVLHGRWMWKSPMMAGVWKRIHYDHHSDPNNLKVLFGALYTTLPSVALATMPVGYLLAGWPGALAALCAGIVETALYELFHCIEHLGYQPEWSWVRDMKKFHMAHHFHNENGNYGITNLWWDKAIGTFYVGAADCPKSPTVFNLGYDEEEAKRYPYVARLTPNWPYMANPVQRKREMAERAGE